MNTRKGKARGGGIKRLAAPFVAEGVYRFDVLYILRGAYVEMARIFQETKIRRPSSNKE